MELDWETFKKMFPNLAREIASGNQKLPINSVRTETSAGENAASADMFRHYNPDVIDFIRRCDTNAQAEEIISYMERRGEISKEYAEELRKQLKEKGVRSFGTKKEENYYLKRAGLT
ncbi:MAG: DUF2095 domain-containing protein [Candidatus Bathyarchaeota archaeon]|nr:DUF2095 domain-containing protein [Candidatus Bathyarchaeota archaeon]MCX8177897.1 DUF2095 domain-containing protein [Candidatus Bathyarchaeota archaeon]MDW8194281.1 DUF2095 family protein [Nitrososphaerota archaeon]